ncbi:hypothetical protein T03_10357 [Trichinella britovi]|uniref:Uncharacterized protein n=1 Tax=Trichinella britovi TaxID=45882 RepID=A0A0V1DBI0_TRIBR|nr:hypothetical protein T03_10357 [Trichinella britovi]
MCHLQKLAVSASVEKQVPLGDYQKPQSPKMDFQGINPSETIIELQQTCPDGCLLRISRKYCGQTWMLAMHGHWQ